MTGRAKLTRPALIGGGVIAVGLMCVAIGLAAEPGASHSATSGPAAPNRSEPANSASPTAPSTVRPSADPGTHSPKDATAGAAGHARDPFSAADKLRMPGRAAPAPAGASQRRPGVRHSAAAEHRHRPGQGTRPDHHPGKANHDSGPSHHRQANHHARTWHLSRGPHPGARSGHGRPAASRNHHTRSHHAQHRHPHWHRHLRWHHHPRSHRHLRWHRHGHRHWTIPAWRKQPYLIYDSVNPGAIPAHRMTATYATGRYAASPDQVAGRPVLWIDTTGFDPAASVLDVEPGDATPYLAAHWARNRLTTNPKALARIYTMRSEWPAVRAAVATLPHRMQTHIRWWIADPTGAPHIVPGSAATQWYWGNSYDITTAAPRF